MEETETDRHDWFTRLAEHAKRVYSQGGEDGVLQEIFARIGTVENYFVEFGAWDGVHLSNTAHLRLDHGWRGLLLEGSDRADGELVKREYVHAGNIEALFRKYDVPREFDLLSIDIDGNDYWVWKAIESYAPRVVVLEYNVFFLGEMAKTIAYDETHVWDKEGFHLYHGASLAAYEKLGRRKGYALVHTEPYCPNAIFLRRDLLPDDAVLPSLESLTRWDWPEDSYREPPAPPGRGWVSV